MQFGDDSKDTPHCRDCPASRQGAIVDANAIGIEKQTRYFGLVQCVFLCGTIYRRMTKWLQKEGSLVREQEM